MKTLFTHLLVWIFAPVFVMGQILSFTEGKISANQTARNPERSVDIDPSGKYVKVSWNIPEAVIAQVSAPDGIYQFIHVPGFAQTGKTGAPALPLRKDRIALPLGASAKIIIESAEYITVQGFNIHPALKPAMDTEGAPEPQFEKNSDIYGKNEFYPDSPVEISGTYQIREVPVAIIHTVPVQYNPITGEIKVYKSISFRIDFAGLNRGFEAIGTENSRTFTDNFKNSVLNPQSIPNGVTSGTIGNSRNGAKNYILITHDAYLTQATQLANSKRQLGYSVEIVSKTNWTSYEVKNAIHSRYDQWIPKPDYALILGDHTGAFAVPGEVHQDPYYADNFATDLYYFCMDGDNDWHPDISGGRISVSSVAEAQVVVDKIINYEFNPVDFDTFYERGLTCAQYQDDDNDGFADRRFCHTSNEIYDYLENEQGYSADRIYYTSSSANVSGLRYNNGYYSYGQLLPAEIREPTFKWDGGANEITASINQGKFLVFHRDHGYVGGSGWAHPYYTTSTMSNLSNGEKLPVIFSINCHTGEYQLTECFAEKLIRMENKGAVGVVGAAYYSFSGFNDALAEGMIDAIWPEPGLLPEFGSGGTGAGYTCGKEITEMGNVVRQGLYAMEVNWGGSASSDQYQYELFHWFGDPAMKIWKSNPNHVPATAQHAMQIDCAEFEFHLTKTTPGAVATLLFNNELLAQTIIDEAGNGTINYSIQNPGAEIILTVSKDNCKPYVNTLEVTGSCTFPPSLFTYGAESISTESAVLKGEITNDFGSDVTQSGFVYSILPHPAIGNTGSITVFTNPPVNMGLLEKEITGIDPQTTFYFRSFGINANGTGYGNEMSFETVAEAYQIPYTEAFENGGNWPADWTTDNDNVWSISTNWNGVNNPGGYHVFSDYYPYETGSVMTPVFDGTGKTELQVKFYHYWRANYSSGAQDGYFYGSRDGGQTWPYLIDEWHHNNPGTEEGEKLYDISSWADGYEGLAFKWVVTHNNDWYWEFDNFEIFEDGVHGLWTGNFSNNWNEPGNWHDGMVPDELTDVLIPAQTQGGNFPETNNGPGAVCLNIIIEENARLFVPSNNTLTVFGTLANNAGTDGLVIKSGAGGITGSLIHSTPDVEASVEQYLTQLNWHLVGIPVQYAEAGVFCLPGQSEIYLNAFIESTGNWGPWIVGVTTPLEPGRGYECWVSDNVNQDETITFKGLLNTGEVTSGSGDFYNLSFTTGQGFNLVSNPFPCSLEADLDTWEKENVGNTVWTWSESDGNYLYWNSTNIEGSNGYGTLPGGFIPPVQGFFVLANGKDPQITIPDRAKAHGDQAFYKKRDFSANSLKIGVEGSLFSDAAFITFNDAATAGYDWDFDTPKMFGYDNAPQLYTLAGDKPLSINVQPQENKHMAVPLAFECSENGSYSLEFSGFESFHDQVPVFLEDLHTGEKTNVVIDPVYNFNHTNGNEPFRFLVHFGNPTDINELRTDDLTLYAFEGKIHLQTTATQSSVVLTNLQGKICASKTFSGRGTHTFNPTLKKGCYILKCKNNKGQFKTIKVIL
ncbi:MAG: T9SS type A sorting domain-containing protein [Bacteroidales bacterium]|nr:T9SS type A sorting domain-containing protein [Bacteroidales bacterium]